MEETALTVAVPQKSVEVLDGEGKLRELFAVVSDDSLGEPIELYSSANAWWVKEDGLRKLEKLMKGFKSGLTIEEACSYAGIAINTYYYFIQIHPKFSGVKDVLLLNPAIQAKVTLIEGLKDDPQLALRYLQGAQPEIYKRGGLSPITDPGTYSKRTEEAFTDDKGNLVMSRETAELIKNYGASHIAEHSGE